MVSVNDIFTAVNRLIAGAFTDVPIYINYCPTGFQRPSILIRCGKVTCEDVNRKTVHVTAGFTIVCFTSADNYLHSDIQELAERQNDVLSLFKNGYIPVGDRAIKVKAETGTTDSDFTKEVKIGLGDRELRLTDASSPDYESAEISLEFEYFDDRSADKDTAELMGTVTTGIHLQC